MNFFRFTCLIPLFVVANAHSRLSSPADEVGFYCRASDGCGPCRLPRKGQPSMKVAATWKRGQKVRYYYERNNHKDGIVRLSIIPTNYRMNYNAHGKYAFEYHCFAGLEQKCPHKKLCGGDKEGVRHYHDFVVPSCIPDGVYHFSSAWYGGGDSHTGIAYSTYYSCAVIKIQGGDAVRASSVVNFTASKNPKNSPGKCNTHATNPYQCSMGPASDRKKCPRRSEFQAVPDEFEAEGPSPRLSITSEMFGTPMTPGTGSPRASPKPPSPSPMARERPQQSSSPKTRPPNTKPAKKSSDYRLFCKRWLLKNKISELRRYPKRTCKCRRFLGWKNVGQLCESYP